MTSENKAPQTSLPHGLNVFHIRNSRGRLRGLPNAVTVFRKDVGEVEENGPCYLVTVSICSPKDPFSRKVGFALASSLQESGEGFLVKQKDYDYALKVFGDEHSVESFSVLVSSMSWAGRLQVLGQKALMQLDYLSRCIGLRPHETISQEVARLNKEKFNSDPAATTETVSVLQTLQNCGLSDENILEVAKELDLDLNEPVTEEVVNRVADKVRELYPELIDQLAQEGTPL